MLKKIFFHTSKLLVPNSKNFHHWEIFPKKIGKTQKCNKIKCKEIGLKSEKKKILSQDMPNTE
jgi:hypothetical protein